MSKTYLKSIKDRNNKFITLYNIFQKLNSGSISESQVQQLFFFMNDWKVDDLALMVYWVQSSQSLENSFCHYNIQYQLFQE